jgi:hypothetical protein
MTPAYKNTHEIGLYEPVLISSGMNDFQHLYTAHNRSVIDQVVAEDVQTHLSQTLGH